MDGHTQPRTLAFVSIKSNKVVDKDCEWREDP